MRRPTILLGGGYDKDSEYTEWINSFDGKVKKLILMGATKEKIARDCEKCDFHDYVYVDTFEEEESIDLNDVLKSMADIDQEIEKVQGEFVSLLKDLTSVDADIMSSLNELIGKMER